MTQKRRYRVLFFTLILCFNLTSCNSAGLINGFGNKDSYAETVFEAYLPEPLENGEVLYLEILDEVTGIALNPTRFEMQSKDILTYYIRIPLAIESLVKYRFIKAGTENSIEYTGLGSQIHSRVYMVQSASIVPNIIAGWDSEKIIGGTGEISGYIFDNKTEAPIPEVMIHLNGLRSITGHDGFFIFENVPAGELYITALHPSGSYLPFQQKAIVAENAVTPSTFGMDPANIVDVRFIVSVPENTTAGSPIRLIGDVYQLGNTFSELKGGGSIISSRAPILQMRKDGKYETTLSLPASLTLNYKYSLGDGFINAEHFNDGQFQTRTISIPNKKTNIEDEIESWSSSDDRFVSFNIKAPENTRNTDMLSIQFNPYSWIEPIPAWKKTGSNKWMFNLFGPMEYLDGAQYRFCRNEQCGIADDAVTHGSNPVGYEINLGNESKLSIQYALQNWFGSNDNQYQIFTDLPQAPSYLANNGFEIAFPYDIHWNEYLQNGLIEAGVAGSEWILFSPSWTFTNYSTHQAGLLPGKDPFEIDIDKLKNKVTEAGMQFAIYPKPNLQPNAHDYWTNTPLTYNWWQNWMDSYERFILNYADYAELNGVTHLIIGGEAIAPALPGGSLPNGVPSNLPVDINDKWLALLDKVRSRYNGKISFALPYPVNKDAVESLLLKTDEIYIEFSSALTSSDTPSVVDIEQRMGKILDEEIYQLYATNAKPIKIAINYYSINGSASDCVNLETPCGLILSNSEDKISIDVIEQADIYQGILRAVSQRSWISGFISQGFNPSVAVGDASRSVHGKPAMQVVSHYFRNPQ